MNITIQKAKNGEETACAEGHFLHSNYAPKKEAERFVQNLNIPYTPSAIIISEPVLSYTVESLRQQYPQTKIGAIRYTPDFNNYNSGFDFVFNYYEHQDFEVYLESKLNEEELLTAFFTPWQPSQQVFKEADKLVWNAIKSALLRSKTLLITRQYFEKKWFLNSCNFIKYVSKQVSLQLPVKKEILIMSSGPILNPFINFIKEDRNKFFILCLSSAISVCLENEIIPDLCMTTDGGYWAGEHLKVLSKNNIPVGMPSETYFQKNILSDLNILPLDYGDGISSELVGFSELKPLRAVRNGTVSGTALLFAANYCTKNIYLCGMDMACQKGFQHAQPNQLELNSSLFDSRLHTKQARLTRSEFNGGSLNIYRDWFINNPINLGNRKVFRLIEEKDRKNNLGWIKDISLKEFERISENILETEQVCFSTERFQKNLSDLQNFISKNENNEKWKKQLFPLDYVLYSHNPDNEQVKEKINKEWNELKNKAWEIFNADL